MSRKTPPHKQILAQIKAEAAKMTDPDEALEFLHRLQRGLVELVEATHRQSGPAQHMASVRQRVESWIDGAPDAEGAPTLSPEQAEALRGLLAQTRIVAVRATEPEPDLSEVEIDFEIGAWRCRGSKTYSYGRQTETAYIGEGLMTNYGDMRLQPHHIDEAALTAAATAIPTALPPEVLFLYIFIVALDDELFVRWNPRLDEIDMTSWPYRPL